MAWEQRGNSGAYFYRSVRTSQGVRKQYFGTGEEAHRESERMAHKQAALRAEKQLIMKEEKKLANAERLTQDLIELSTLFFEASLLTAGYWRGRDYRKWRKRRGIKE